jgi:hypothetical protein
MRSEPLSVILIAGMAMLSAAENCSAALSSVTLDWSQLKTQVLPIGANPAPVLAFTGQSTHISTNASSDGDGSESFDHTLPNWSDARNFAANTSNAVGNASASSATVALSSSATAPNVCCGSISSSFIERSAGFSLSGPGAVFFSVPYTLSTSGTPFDFSNFSSLNINGSANFSTFDSLGGSFSSGSKSISADTNSPISTSGMFTFGLLASNAGTGSLDFTLSTNANAFGGFVVPEPSTLLGLVAGLGAVVVVGTRRIATV